MYREEEINFLSVRPTPPQKKIYFFICLLCVSEHSECFLKPVKKLGMGWRPTHPIGNNSQISPFFFLRASLSQTSYPNFPLLGGIFCDLEGAHFASCVVAGGSVQIENVSKGSVQKLYVSLYRMYHAVENLVKKCC